MSGRLFIVLLRRPRKDDPRTDPFWEMGSFGCTGCHDKNLLHPKNCQIRDDDKLAFVQGGHLGPRVLLVTPPVARSTHPGGGAKGRVELRWDSTHLPFRYDRAPALFASDAPGRPSLFPGLAASIAETNRSTYEAKFASRFRSRASPLEPELAAELESGFATATKSASAGDFIVTYDQALPWCDCPTPAAERPVIYRQLLERLTSEISAATQPTRGCGRKDHREGLASRSGNMPRSERPRCGSR